MNIKFKIISILLFFLHFMIGCSHGQPISVSIAENTTSQYVCSMRYQYEEKTKERLDLLFEEHDLNVPGAMLFRAKLFEIQMQEVEAGNFEVDHFRDLLRIELREAQNYYKNSTDFHWYTNILSTLLLSTDLLTMPANFDPNAAIEFFESFTTLDQLDLLSIATELRLIEYIFTQPGVSRNIQFSKLIEPVFLNRLQQVIAHQIDLEGGAYLAFSSKIIDLHEDQLGITADLVELKSRLKMEMKGVSCP